MAKLVLKAYRAQRSEDGALGVVFDLRKGPPFPTKIVEIKRAADAIPALQSYKAEAAQTGQPLAVSMDIAETDRSPPGFNALNRPYYHGVNV